MSLDEMVQRLVWCAIAVCLCALTPVQEAASGEPGSGLRAVDGSASSSGNAPVSYEDLLTIADVGLPGSDAPEGPALSQWIAYTAKHAGAILVSRLGASSRYFHFGSTVDPSCGMLRPQSFARTNRPPAHSAFCCYPRELRATILGRLGQG